MMDITLQLVQPQNLLLYLFAYGLAAMPTSYWVAMILHRVQIERRKVHSHTATYMWQHLSMGSALLVLSLDILKGVIPSAIALSLDQSPEVIACIGLFAVFGHCFSVLLRFSGGHGGATFAGSLLVLAYPVGIITLLTNYLFTALKFAPGLASMIAVLLATILTFFLVTSYVVWLIVVAMTIVIFLRHQLSEQTKLLKR